MIVAHYLRVIVNLTHACVLDRAGRAWPTLAASVGPRGPPINGAPPLKGLKARLTLHEEGI